MKLVINHSPTGRYHQATERKAQAQEQFSSLSIINLYRLTGWNRPDVSAGADRSRRGAQQMKLEYSRVSDKLQSAGLCLKAVADFGDRKTYIWTDGGDGVRAVVQTAINSYDKVETVQDCTGGLLGFVQTGCLS